MTQAETFSPADGLAADMVQALKAEGLYEKEALAMVKTWRDSWFIEQGTRLFYLLPQEKTDELLPLTITPRPDEVVRVMVGRLEIMRPEHSAPNAEWFEKGIVALDAPLPVAAKTTFSNAAKNEKGGQLGAALEGYGRAAAHGGEQEFAAEAKTKADRNVSMVLRHLRFAIRVAR